MAYVRDLNPRLVRYCGDPKIGHVRLSGLFMVKILNGKNQIAASLHRFVHEMVFIPLRAKRVGQFIEIRHKNISPTHILNTLGCL